MKSALSTSTPLERLSRIPPPRCHPNLPLQLLLRTVCSLSSTAPAELRSVILPDREDLLFRSIPMDRLPSRWALALAWKR